MENKFPGRSYIEKIAEILMEEGDVETAKALKQQAVVTQSREMTEEEVELYEINKSNVRKAIGLGDLETLNVPLISRMSPWGWLSAHLALNTWKH